MAVCTAPGSCTASGPAVPWQRWSRGTGAGVEQLIEARRQAIRGVASQYDVGGIRWWPPTVNPTWLDFLVEGEPEDLPAFRSDLERALGCRVAVYPVDRIPKEAWGRILVETVTL